MKTLACRKPRGITLLEALISITILALAVIGIIQGMSMGYRFALRSRAAAEAEMRAMGRMEDIMAMPYDDLDTSTYPVEYATETQTVSGVESVQVVYAMTTTITRLTSPECKYINLSVTWGRAGIERNNTYFMIKSP